MSTGYPLVEERALSPARRSGLIQRHRTRAGEDLPRPAAHQVLVYRVDGGYVLDPAKLGQDHSTVVDASHVSVVDMRHDAQVEVRLAIPSVEASEFPVLVTFACTVHNAVTVVREGIRSAAAALETYLRGHRRIFELGLNASTTQINGVRRDVNAQIRAFTTVRPPLVPGLAVTLVSVEVHTPAELAELAKRRRGLRDTHTLDAERLQFDQMLDLERASGESRLRGLRQEQEHVFVAADTRFQNRSAVEQLHHDQQIAAERLYAELRLDEARRGHLLSEVSKTAAVVASDFRSALLLAHINGELGAGEYAERIRADQERRDAMAADDAARARAELETLRQEQRADAERARQGEERRRLERRKDAEIESQLAREDRRRLEEAARADTRRAIEVKLELLREFAKRGHFDLVNVNLDRLVGELVPTTAPWPAESPRGATRDQLAFDDPATLRAGGAPDTEHSDHYADVREEDG
ncbi:hypothetical protein [Parafrankia sp. EUN1f]|uniref:hypothetical protein n=1 Tax=Parafrankia sp. EUN1f TaxID=102897 RepID=UPI0001C474C6|nr:hypothetical protein [Parafrankia sp. EUN1f]EFC79780.1 hypothetical protein FrEUN1fDRAFT_7109 [Parafrankia sp. EUN1f]